MAAVSLVVCLHRESLLLKRLLAAARDCFDDLVVVHDGPEDEKVNPVISEIVQSHGGRFFVGPRSHQQEPHWPFAWAQTRADWILRLDADEAPSKELRQWLLRFRESPEPSPEVAGYSCIWPLWNGHALVTKRWPGNRLFLFHKERVRFFGMVEQVPVAEGRVEAVALILEHRPIRKSYGFRNLLLRPQAYAWRREIARSLLNEPSDLACWRWGARSWPSDWEQIRDRPLRTGLYRLFIWPAFVARDMLRVEGRLILGGIFAGGVHHCLIAFKYLALRHRKRQS